MGLATYAVIESDDGWGVLHDGDVEGKFLTKESAFEAAVAAASLRSARDTKSMLVSPAAKLEIRQRSVQQINGRPQAAPTLATDTIAYLTVPK